MDKNVQVSVFFMGIDMLNKQKKRFFTGYNLRINYVLSCRIFTKKQNNMSHKLQKNCFVYVNKIHDFHSWGVAALI